MGTSAPGAKLNVVADSTYSSAGTEAFLIGNATTPQKQIRIGYDTAIDAGYLQSVHSGTGYKSLLLNPNGGNVGIGTNAPATKFHVAGDSTVIDGLSMLTSFTPTSGVARFAWWDPENSNQKFI